MPPPLRWPWTSRRPPAPEPVRERLLADRIVALVGPVDEEQAHVVIAQLLYLQDLDPDADVQLYVDSPGGSVFAAMAIADTLEELSPPVITTCLGRADGAAAMVLAAGAQGARTALSTATVTLTPVEHRAGASGAAEVVDRVFDRLAALTGQPRARLEALARERRPLAAEEARALGLVDVVYTRAPA